MEMAHPLNSGDSRDAILSVDDPMGALIMTRVRPDPDNPDTCHDAEERAGKRTSLSDPF
jgi:hypothetical protein